MGMPQPPTNDMLFSVLEQSIWTNHCIAIIGSGLSVGDYPVWSELTDILQDRCSVRPEDSVSTDPLDVAEAAKKKGPVYFKVLDEVFQRKEYPRSRDRYHLLARIPFSSYVTLNFDTLLLDTIALHKDVTVSEYPVLQNQHHRNAELFYLHGRLGPDRPAAVTQIVLTRKEFEDAYDPYANRLHGFLQSTFLDNDVCFIGCNPSEAHMQRLLEACRRFSKQAHGIHDTSIPRWFLLWDDESEVPPVLAACGIHAIRYGKVSPDFSGFDQVLKYLARKKEPVFRKLGREQSPFSTDVEPGL